MLSLNKYLKLLFLLSFLSIFAVIAGCVNTPSVQSPQPTDKITLNIAYMSEQAFQSRYGNTLEQQFPDVRYTIVPTIAMMKGEKTVLEWSKMHDADLIYVPAYLMQDFVHNSLLLDLGTLFKKNKFDLSSYVPNIMTLTRSYGNGEIYGLPPTFNGKAVLYNKDLFDKYKIDYPVDRMGWEDLIHLAERFPSHGLAVSSLSTFHFIYEIGRTDGYQLQQENPPKSLVNSPGWEKVWELAADPMKKGLVTVSHFSDKDFLSGNTGMAIVSYTEFLRIQRSKPSFQWDAITVPVNDHQPDTTQQTTVDGFYCIPATSKNVTKALELLEFLTSDKVSRLDGTAFYGIGTMQKGNPDLFVQTVEKLTPVISEDIPYNYLTLGNQAADAVLKQSVPIQTALNDFQESVEKAAAEQSFKQDAH